MKKQLFAISLLATFMSFPLHTEAKKTLRVVSYNLLWEKSHLLPKDTVRLWVNRLPNVVNFFNTSKPDVLGAQELHTFQLYDVLKGTGYKRIGCDLEGSMDGGGENEAIFYNPETVEVMEDGHIWFSETPDISASFSWGMKYPRMCNWGKFRQKSTGKIFYVFNSHFYVGADMEHARSEAARLILKKIHEVIGDYPVVCTGDFNEMSDAPAVKKLIDEGPLSDSRKLVKKPKGPEGSYHGFRKVGNTGKIVDHVLVSKKVKVKKYQIIDEQQKTGKFESDHFPVCADVQLR